MRNLIISLTTIPGRLAYFRRAIESILKQKDISYVSRIVVNLQDFPETNPDDYAFVTKPDHPLPVKVEAVVRPRKWGSANKLLWTYADNPDATVVTMDDDIVYPPTCIGELVDAAERNPGCIVCQESNPVRLDGDGKVEFANRVEYAFGMRGFSKYLTNACLFPPRSLGPVSSLLDYDGFMALTDGRHDELWFWVHSTLNGVKSVVLPNTYSFVLDRAALPADEHALCRINAVPANIAEYNRSVNEIYGSRLADVFGRERVQIPVDLANYGMVMLGVSELHGAYGMFGIDLVASDELRMSHVELLMRVFNRHTWARGVRVVVSDRLREEFMHRDDTSNAKTELAAETDASRAGEADCAAGRSESTTTTTENPENPEKPGKQGKIRKAGAKTTAKPKRSHK